MNEQKSRSYQLLNRVYDHLDSIDVTKLSMRDLTDFLEVVQKGQFLESFGATSALGFHYCASPFAAPGKSEPGESNAE